MLRPVRIHFDSNVLDKFLIRESVEDDTLIAFVNQGIADGRFVILVTHVQEDELAATTNPDKRESLLRVLEKLDVTKIPTSGGIWDHSKWGEASWGDGTGPIRIEHIQKGNPKHSKDALIATTASSDADVLVTAETKTLPNRIRAQNTASRVWTFEQFKDFLGLDGSNKVEKSSADGRPR